MTIEFVFDENNSKLISDATNKNFEVYMYRHDLRLFYDVAYCVDNKLCQLRRHYDRKIYHYVLDEGWKTLFFLTLEDDAVQLSWNEAINIITLDIL